MKLDDESHLSAYLDDELDPADRLAVEWSVEANPPRADRLRSIALARDAVAGLDRPPIPRDLASSVGSRIALDRRRARLRSLARPAFALTTFAAVAAVAASLILAIILLNRSLHETSDRQPALVQVEPIPVPLPHPINSSNPAPIPATPRPLVLGTSPKLVADRPRPIPDEPNPSAPLGDPADRAGRRSMGGILGRSHVRRVVIVTDVIDASEQVSDLILSDARQDPEFGRISIQQEIVLDPDHPDAADVFAVPIDERGRRSFVDRLQRLFPDLVEEGRTRPELVTQLTEVGRVVVLRGLKAAPLGDPPGDIQPYIANRESDRAPLIIEADRGPIDMARSESTHASERHSASNSATSTGSNPASLGPDFIGPPDLDRKAPPRPGERVTLLVWVTRPPRH